MAQLTWNGSNYEATLDDGRTLTVNGDDFAEEKLDMAKAYFVEAHPGASKDDFANAEDAGQFIDQATEELIDASAWEDSAVEVDRDGDPIDKSIKHGFAAWIK